MSQCDDQAAMTVTDIQTRHAADWQALQTFLHGLSYEQLTGPTDAAGWTIKDHVIHLALWEKTLQALLNSESRPASIAIDEAVWKQGYEEVNQILYQRYRDVPLDEVYATLETTRQALIARINQFSDSDLLRPHREFQASSNLDDPIVRWMAYEHYAEHLPWMQAILAR
ncbi:MAG: ClbS/DfsB family four-helix bundle protein [Chloroflexi bacterium]|nr:ClbS/DfsB family four-helix bundle protein [Chloroflexota bacterium]